MLLSNAAPVKRARVCRIERQRPIEVRYCLCVFVLREPRGSARAIGPIMVGIDRKSGVAVFDTLVVLAVSDIEGRTKR